MPEETSAGRMPAGFDEHFVRATCDGESTVGIIEVANPVIYEWCRDGRPGYELLRD